MEGVDEKLLVFCDEALPNMENSRTFIRILDATGEHEPPAHPLSEEHDGFVECRGLLSTMKTRVRRDTSAQLELETAVVARDSLRGHGVIVEKFDDLLCCRQAKSDAVLFSSVTFTQVLGHSSVSSVALLCCPPLLHSSVALIFHLPSLQKVDGILTIFFLERKVFHLGKKIC